MSAHTEPEPGDTLELSVTNRSGELEVGAHLEYDLVVPEEPDLEPGESRSITVRVTKTWYSTSGDPRAVTVVPEPESGDEDTPHTAETTDDEATSHAAETTDDDGSLDEIADELLAGMEFEVERTEESIVGSARRRAKERGRDPAIDPRLSDSS